MRKMVLLLITWTGFADVGLSLGKADAYGNTACHWDSNRDPGITGKWIP